MSIDWGSLLLVAVVAIVSTGLFALLLAFGIRLLAQARAAANTGQIDRPARIGGWILLGLIGLMIAFALYLIVPQFH